MLVELIRSAERKRCEIRELIKAIEEAEVQRAEELLKRMEQEVIKLKKRDNELVQLPHIDDDFLFLVVTLFIIYSCPLGFLIHDTDVLFNNHDQIIDQ